MPPFFAGVWLPSNPTLDILPNVATLMSVELAETLVLKGINLVQKT